MNISFSETTEQIRQHQKHVTRRIDKSLRLANLKPGTILQGIEKAQGLKKGEHVVKLDQIIILKVNREPLDEIIKNPVRELPDVEYNFYSISEDCHYTKHGSRHCDHPGMQCTCDFDFCPGIPEVDLEGFPQLTPVQFVEMFCQINKKCTPETEITRVLFDYVVKL